MHSIQIKDVKYFNSFENFSFQTASDIKSYSHPNQSKRFTNSYLGVNRHGELVIAFQNRITRFFGQFFHCILTTLHIRHETTNSKDVWQALKKHKIINESLPYPVSKNKKQIREIFGKIIHNHVKEVYQKANPAYHPANDNTMKQFQKYVYYLDQNQDQDIKNLLNALPDWNGYFEKSIDTPLTLAVKKESLDTIHYLLSLKDKKGLPLIDVNKATKDGKSPLLLATQKDLPRRFFIPLFQAGAVPKDEKEVAMIIKSACDNQALIRNIRNVFHKKAIDWPEPKLD